MGKEILINQPEEWNRIVTGFHKYDVYYLSEYVKAFQTDSKHHIYENR